MLNVIYENGIPQTVDGKAVKGSSKRGWKKAMQTSYFKKLDDFRTFEVQNPFSGVFVDLNGLEATIYHWLCEWYYIRYERGRETEAPLQTYDDMKYFLLELNSQAYMDLID